MWYYNFMQIDKIATSFFQIISRLLNVNIFGSSFSLKLSLRTDLISIKTLKRYCRATLDEFFNKKQLHEDKKFCF